MPPLALSFMVLIAIMRTAIGTAAGSVLQDMQGFQLIMNFVVLPLFFLSSALVRWTCRRPCGSTH